MIVLIVSMDDGVFHALSNDSQNIEMSVEIVGRREGPIRLRRVVINDVNTICSTHYYGFLS